MDLDAFATYLARQQQLIRDRTGCDQVSFRIVEENGKKKLKAKPVREVTARESCRCAAVLPALALTLALAPDGAGEAPPQLGAAIAEQRNLVSARPSDAGVWNDLGNLLVMSGNLDEADERLRPRARARPRQRAGALQPRPAAPAARRPRRRGERVPRAARARAAPRAGLSISSAPPTKPRASASSRSSATPPRSRSIPSSLFAESNPHIIENRLVTEALLLARRGSRSGPATPRSYDEEARINSILTPPAPSLDVEPPPAEDAEAADSQPSGDAAERRRRPRSDRSRRGAPRPRPTPGHRHRRLGQGPGAQLERSARERAQPGARRRRRRRRPGGTQLATPSGGDGHTAGWTTPVGVAAARR